MSSQRPEDYIDEIWRMTPCRLAERLTAGKFRRYPHIQFLSRKIAQTILKGDGRLIISMPPRHGKSWLTSLWTPIWFLSLFPDRHVLLATYESDFSAHWGRQVRNLISEYSPQLGIKLTDDSKAADRWNTPEGGGMFTTGIGGPITGRGGNLIVVDDPVKNQEQASSETYRERAIEWFNSTLYTRAEPGATMIVLMTRWHQRDLAGYLLTDQANRWEEIRLPAIAEENDQLGREVGRALCPERFDEETLETTQVQVGSRVWNALYQQRPSAEEGNIFRREWRKFYRDEPAAFTQVIQSWDLSFKETKSSDFVVCQVWGAIGADRYLLYQMRARMDFTATL